MMPTSELSARGRRTGASRRFTWADFVALGDDDRRELEDGRLVEAEVPTRLHAWISAVLLRELGNWAVKSGLGYPLGDGYKVRVTDARGVIPDVLFIRHDNPSRIEEQGVVEGYPDLAVEIVSASPADRRRDRIRKQHDYAFVGVPEYWLIDPEARTLEQLVLDGEHYRIESSLAGDEVFRPGTFKGLAVRLAELWTLPEPKKKPRASSAKKTGKKSAKKTKR